MQNQTSPIWAQHALSECHLFIVLPFHFFLLSLRLPLRPQPLRSQPCLQPHPLPPLCRVPVLKVRRQHGLQCERLRALCALKRLLPIVLVSNMMLQHGMRGVRTITLLTLESLLLVHHGNVSLQSV